MTSTLVAPPGTRLWQGQWSAPACLCAGTVNIFLGDPTDQNADPFVTEGAFTFDEGFYRRGENQIIRRVNVNGVHVTFYAKNTFVRVNIADATASTASATFQSSQPSVLGTVNLVRVEPATLSYAVEQNHPPSTSILQ